MLLHYAVLSLLRNWKSLIGLILIYTLLVAFYASFILFTTALKKETDFVLQFTPQLWVQKIAGGRLVPMDNHFTDSLKNIRGIKKIIPRIWGYNFDSPTGAVFTIMGSDSLTQGLEMVESINEGRAVRDGEARCGTGFLALRGLEIGEKITLLDNKGKINSFKVVAAFNSKSDLLSKDLIILSPSSARNMLGLDSNQMTDLAIEIYNNDETNQIGRKIDQRFAGIRVVTSEQLKSTYQTLFGWRGAILVYGSMMSVFAFLILVWQQISGLTNRERQELGILKAIGWHITDVLWLKFWQGAIISITSTFSGILLGYLHVFVFKAYFLKNFLIGWSVLYPDYRLTPVLDFESILLIFSFSVIPYLSATIIPAWQGAITDPAEIMKN